MIARLRKKEGVSPEIRLEITNTRRRPRFLEKEIGVKAEIRMGEFQSFTSNVN
jgi:hypothetical protein